MNLLQQSSGSYQETEGANQAGAAAFLAGQQRVVGPGDGARTSGGPITGLINDLDVLPEWLGPLSSNLFSACRWMRWVTSPPPNRT